MTYKVKIIIPSCVLVECDTRLTVAPGKDGVFGVLRNHEPLIANLKPGIVKILSSKRSGNDVEHHTLNYFVYGGIAKVENNELNIITEFSVNLASTKIENILNNIASIKSEILAQRTQYKADILEHTLSKYNDLLSFL